MESILIIDDEIDIREILKYNLEKEGFNVFESHNGVEGIKIAENILPDLIILDVMMPDMDGIEVCHSLRENEKTSNIKICFLTARNEDYSQIAGFDAGADDYVAKPIKPKVLISRIKAILKRSKIDLKQETITIDNNRHSVIIKGKSTILPKKEFDLLKLLLSNPNKVFKREYILKKVWGKGVIVVDRTIDVHIRKLRKKIGSNYIKTIKGVGYQFIDSTE